MLKTNNKQVKEYFNEYLNDILKSSFDNNIESMAYQFSASTTNSLGKLDTRNYKTYQEAFEVVSMNYGECYYEDMKNTLKEALQETEEEANKYSNNKVQQIYSYLLYSAYLRKCKKENINPFKYFKA